MKRNILFLSIACALTVAALAAIQGYFIYNTFRLKEKEVKDEIQKQLLELEDAPAFDSINDVWMEKTREFTKGYVAHKLTRTDYEKLIQSHSDSLSKAILKLMDKFKVNARYKAHYSNYLTSVVIESGGNNDTLYKGKMLLYGDNSAGENQVPSSTGRWRSKSSDRVRDTDLTTEAGNAYSFEVRTERYYNIDNWAKVVLGRMVGLFTFSVLLVAFVVILFYLSLRNLISQKKVSDIKTDFVNNITHEFKTPIATLDIAIRTFERDDATNEQVQNAIAIIKRQNTRLQSLFGQVKDASLSSSSIIADTATVNTVKDIAEIINDFRTACPHVGISLSAAADAGLKMAPSHLYTLLVNLLDNAVKYGADVIDVEVKSTPGQTILSVKDNGPGIPEQERSAVFEKFYRIQKGNVHNVKGLGLGLFYVSQIVYAYNGNISAANQNGALFTITLPTT